MPKKLSSLYSDVLHPFQKEGVQHLVKRRYAILCDEMGLGKSIQSLVAAMAANSKNILVVAPAYLRHNWYDEWAKWFDDPKVKFNAVSYAQMAKFPHLFEQADTVIFDEAHYLKNPRAQRTKTAHKFVKGYLPENLYLLSGTPVTNHVADYWSLLHLLSQCPHNTNGAPLRMNYWSFLSRFSNPYVVRFGGRSITQYKGHRNVEELKGYLKGKYLRRTKDTVGSLPEYVRKIVHLKDHWSGDSEIEDVKDLVKRSVDEHYITWRKKCCEEKAKYTVKYVKDILEQGGGPVLLLSDFLSPVDLLKEGLKGYRVEVITGGTDMDKRQMIKDQFQAGKVDVLVATIRSVRFGLTLTAANQVVFNDFSYSPADIRQVEDRIHRIGQKRTCFSHFLLLGRVDRMVFEALKPKIETIKAVVERS